MAISKEQQYFDITLTTLISAMGKLMPFLQDEEVFEVYLNDDGKIWKDSFKGRCYTGVDMEADVAVQIIKNVAALTGQVIADSYPEIDAEIPKNSYFEELRFHGKLPRIVSRPTFNIRKQPKVIFTLDDYVKQGIMTESQREVILTGIKNKKNIIAAGGTKSGKTTLLNAILYEISKYDDRVVLIEDTKELQCSAVDKVSILTLPTYTMSDALRGVLRMTPDRIVVGEVRGGEVLALLDAWSTGHGGGCSTVHSNSAVDTLLRLEDMTTRVANVPQQRTIGQAVDYIVYLKYHAGKRKIEDIVEVLGFDPVKQSYKVKKIG